MILLFLIIILIGLNVLKLVWSKNNASMNFRGGKMLEVNNVVVSHLISLSDMMIKTFVNFEVSGSNKRPCKNSCMFRTFVHNELSTLHFEP